MVGVPEAETFEATSSKAKWGRAGARAGAGAGEGRAGQGGKWQGQEQGQDKTVQGSAGQGRVAVNPKPLNP